jgi:hypothetical protein
MGMKKIVCVQGKEVLPFDVSNHLPFPTWLIVCASRVHFSWAASLGNQFRSIKHVLLKSTRELDTLVCLEWKKHIIE